MSDEASIIEGLSIALAAEKARADKYQDAYQVAVTAFDEARARLAEVEARANKAEAALQVIDMTLANEARATARAEAFEEAAKIAETAHTVECGEDDCDDHSTANCAAVLIRRRAAEEGAEK
jgi:hypothetical protein